MLSLVQLSCPGFLSSLTEQSCRTDSTKATIILSDMSTIDKGPFAVVPGSHKAVRVPRLSRASLPPSDVRGWCGSLQNLDPRKALDLSDATKTYLCEPVFADAGDGECGNGWLGPCWRDSDGRPLL